MDDLISRSATQIAQALHSRAVSAVEVVTAYLDRIAVVNRHINAVVQLDAERALAQARIADTQLAQGPPIGPLHGLPWTVKDVFQAEGMICAAGLEERARLVPQEDAVVVARMKAAGAILLGKTNCPPGGGGGSTTNPVYGRTNNPYDLARTPGGSSGGEAAIQAVAGSALGIGSDSGGSLRLPAHYCGVATLKPTFGRVPNTGVFNHPGGISDIRTQIGPITRYVEDLSLVFPVIAGPDWWDSSVVPMPISHPDDVAHTDLQVAWYADDGSAAPTDEIKAVVRAAALQLADIGMIVEEARPTHLSEAWPISKGYWSMDQLSGAEIEQLMTDWDRYRSQMLAFMRRYDMIICPVDAHPAPLHDEHDPLRFSYTLPFSLTGYPCVVVPAGRSAEGLPIGLQIVARPWREDVALAVARFIEQTMGGYRPPPVL